MQSTRTTEYKESLGIFSTTSTHIDLIFQAIKKHIFPQLNQRDTMIDVGAGIGAITKKLRPFFQEVTVIDCNPNIKADITNQADHVEIGDFLEFNTDKKYDLVLCSHVLYFADPGIIQAFIQKLQSLVKEGGYCFIALIAPRGQNHLFHSQYDIDYINSKKIIEALEKLNIPYDKIESAPHHFVTQSDSEIKNLLKFCLMANCPTPKNPTSIDSIVEQEIQSCQSDDGNYDFQQEDDYFIMPPL